jgi:hypothetical protein
MSLNLTKTLSSAAFALLGYVVIASSGQASATSDLNKCRFDNRQEVIGCCRQALRTNGKPQWMISSRSNCEKATVCIGYRCYVRQRYELFDREGGNNNRNNNNNNRGGELR